MQTWMFLVIMITGIVLTGSVLLMSPKGGIGFGIGWASAGSNEYGSQKSIESTLKNVAAVCAIVMVLCIVVRPYIK